MNAVSGENRAIYFFRAPAVPFFATLTTRNVTLAGIFFTSPVTGLRTVRALRFTRTNRPTPASSYTPVFQARSAISESLFKSRLEIPYVLAISMAVGNGVVILTLAGRAIMLLLSHLPRRMLTSLGGSSY